MDGSSSARLAGDRNGSRLLLLMRVVQAGALCVPRAAGVRVRRIVGRPRAVILRSRGHLVVRAVAIASIVGLPQTVFGDDTASFAPVGSTSRAGLILY